jgi:hypothetical protein
MRQFFVTTLLAGVVAVSAFAIPVIEPASAATKLTHDDKLAIYTRCKKAGGTGKACCAAADGTWESDGQGAGGTCTLGATSLQEGGRKSIAPNKMLVAP